MPLLTLSTEVYQNQSEQGPRVAVFIDSVRIGGLGPFRNFEAAHAAAAALTRSAARSVNEIVDAAVFGDGRTD